MSGARLMPVQVNTVEYQYQPTPFNCTTEKQESYKHWDLPERPARPPVPMRATLPFTGLSHTWAAHLACVFQPDAATCGTTYLNHCPQGRIRPCFELTACERSASAHL